MVAINSVIPILVFKLRGKVATDEQLSDKIRSVSKKDQTQPFLEHTRIVAKELPNTGTAESITAMIAGIASAVLAFGMVGRRRKEDEEI